MSGHQIFTASLLLTEHLGEVVEKVGSYLAKKGSMPMRMISQDLGLSVDQVKKALYTMIQQNVVYFGQHNRGFVEYSLDLNNVLNRIRYPRYTYAAKMMYGDTGELIIEELLQHGQCQMLDLIEKVHTRLNEAYNGEQTVSKSEVYQKFDTLVKTHFIQRCPLVGEASPGDKVPRLEVHETLLYHVPSMETEEANRKRKCAAADGSEPANKRQKMISGEAVDSSREPEVEADIYWKVNLDRFHDYMRDQVIINAILRKFDRKAAEIIRTILRISEVRTDPKAPVTTAISIHEISDQLPKELGINKPLVEQYMSVMVDDSCEFVFKAGDSGGGMFSIHIKKALCALAKCHIESVVQERFGSKCLRIFRLLILKKHLEQKEIEEFAMIPPKEAKEMLYNMFGQNFVTITEIPKTPDHAPSRTFYLFSVNLDAVARSLLHTSFRAIGNVISRRLHETKENKRLLDKQQRVEAIAASLEQNGADPSQKEEVEEMITPPEKAQLNKVKHMTNMLEQSEIQLDDTTFILQMYLLYSQIKS